jgi:hypothetical protein
MSEWIIRKQAYRPSVKPLQSKEKTLKQIHDEVLALGYATDKGTTHSYIDTYSTLFEPYRNEPINFLEIGADFGFSLALWRAYFEKANIYGIDNRDVLQYDEDVKVTFYDANDPSIISKFYSDIEFDIVMDDASHEVNYQAVRFPIYFSKLKKGGLYIIEDVQSLDTEGHILKSLDSNVEVIDLRKVKDRYDDVLMIYRK